MRPRTPRSTTARPSGQPRRRAASSGITTVSRPTWRRRRRARASRRSRRPSARRIAALGQVVGGRGERGGERLVALARQRGYLRTATPAGRRARTRSAPWAARSQAPWRRRWRATTASSSRQVRAAADAPLARGRSARSRGRCGARRRRGRGRRRPRRRARRAPARRGRASGAGRRGRPARRPSRTTAPARVPAMSSSITARNVAPTRRAPHPPASAARTGRGGSGPAARRRWTRPSSVPPKIIATTSPEPSTTGPPLLPGPRLPRATTMLRGAGAAPVGVGGDHGARRRGRGGLGHQRAAAGVAHQHDRLGPRRARRPGAAAAARARARAAARRRCPRPRRPARRRSVRPARRDEQRLLLARDDVGVGGHQAVADDPSRSLLHQAAGAAAQLHHRPARPHGDGVLQHRLVRRRQGGRRQRDEREGVDPRQRAEHLVGGQRAQRGRAGCVERWTSPRMPAARSPGW